jgi:protein tyrosine phosphatase (PTP) superfamily phosphohydrolase (DUF442 family)
VLSFLVLASCFCRTSPPVVQRPAAWAQPVPSKALDNWYKLDEDVYRSEQPNREGFVEIRDHGIKSVLNLRGHHSDEDAAAGLGLVLINVPMSAGGFTEADIVAALKAIESAPKPVVLHCQHGSDRAGVVSAMYRIVFQGWSKEDALAELLGGGFGFHLQYDNIPRFIREVDIGRIKTEMGRF